MKKLFFLFFLVCICKATFSQYRFGIRGGLNIASQKLTLDCCGEHEVIKGDAIPSFHIGATGDIKLNRVLFIQSSLMLNGKGANFKAFTSTETIILKHRLYYIELPLALVAKTRFTGSKLTIYGGGGPSFGYGVFGKVKDLYSDEAFASFQNFDFGINFTAGLEIPSGWQFSIHYTPGLENINLNDYSDEFGRKNKVLAFSLAYFIFSRK